MYKIENYFFWSIELLFVDHTFHLIFRSLLELDSSHSYRSKEKWQGAS
jgi:hypothetical protein